MSGGCEAIWRAMRFSRNVGGRVCPRCGPDRIARVSRPGAPCRTPIRTEFNIPPRGGCCEESGTVSLLLSRLRRSAVAAAAAVLLILPAGLSPAAARPAPDGFADLAEKLLPSVVNISTTQTVKPEGKHEKTPGRPQFPPGSPFEEFFKDFFDHGQRGDRPEAKPRKATSLGSGFVIDPA